MIRSLAGVGKKFKYTSPVRYTRAFFEKGFTGYSHFGSHKLTGFQELLIKNYLLISYPANR